jgi:MFS family permease
MQAESVPSRRSRARRGPFYGWYIVLAGILISIAYSVQFNSAYGVFVHHMTAETGWSRTALAGVRTVTRIPEAIGAVIVGPLVDRYGARWIMVAGGIFMGASLALLATIQEVWQLYLYMGLLVPIGAVCMGGFVPTVAVVNWFVAKRGRAIGILSMGGSLGSVVLPLAASPAIEAWGWRGAWIALAVAVVILTIPAGILVRRRPEDLGLFPDGADGPAETGATTRGSAGTRHRREAARVDVVWTRREVMRTPVMWVMVFAWGVAGFSVTGTNLHMIPHLMDVGAPLMLAAAAVSMRSAASLVGSPLWGYVIERVPLQPVAAVGFLMQGAGITVLLLPPSPATIIAWLLLFGLGGAGSHVVSEVIWAHYYGRLSLGMVRGIAYPFQTGLAALGPLVIGLLFDLTGSYQSSFILMAAGSVIAAMLIQLARAPIPPGAHPAPREP